MSSEIPHPSNGRLIRQEAGALLVLGGPIVAAQLAQIAMGFVDTVMAGHLSPRDLAAVAVGSALWMTLFVFGMGVLLSVSPTIAHAYGAGRNAEVGGHVRQGLWLSQIAALWTFLAVRFSFPLFGWLDVDPEIVPTAVGFLSAISCGAPAICAFTVLRGFSEAVSKTRPVMLISIIGLLANIAGNSIFMHGRFGAPRLGAAGCGVASAIVMWVMLATLSIWIVTDRYYRQFAPFERWEAPRWREIRRLLALGSPIGVSFFMEGSMFTTVSLLMGRLGAATVAGHQIAINVASVTFMVPLGIALAITVRVGQAMGRREPAAARRSGLVGAALAVAFMSLAALVMATCPRLIAAIYSDDLAVRSIAAGLLVMAAVFQIFDGLQVASAASLRGLKDTAIPMAITVVAYWGVGLPLGIGLGIVQNGGPQALWIGLIAGLVVAAFLLQGRFLLLTRRLIAAEGESACISTSRLTPAARQDESPHREQLAIVPDERGT